MRAAAHAPANPQAPGLYFLPEEVSKLYGWSLAYVYKQARKHGWRRTVLQGRVWYWVADVEAARRTRRKRTAA